MAKTAAETAAKTAAETAHFSFVLTSSISFVLLCIFVDHFWSHKKKQIRPLFLAIWPLNRNFFDALDVHASKEAKQPPLGHLKT
jgi:hypothetical protein